MILQKYINQIIIQSLKKVSEESSVIKVDIYSGPGNDYKFEESVNKKQIKIEGFFYGMAYTR